MKKAFRIFWISILLMEAQFVSQATTLSDSLKWKIDHLTATDTSTFNQISDSIEYLSGRDVNKALLICKMLEPQINAIKNNSFRLQTTIYCTQAYLLSGKPDSCKQYLEQGFQQAKALKDSTSLISLYYLKGWLYAENRQAEIAQNANIEGLKIAEATRNYEQQIKFLSALAYNSKDLTDKNTKLKWLYQAVRLGKKHLLTSSSSYQNALYNLAGELQKAGRSDTAILIYQELQLSYEQKKYTSGLASIANNMSHLYMEKKAFKKARDEAFKALNYDTQTGTVSYIASDMITISKVFKKMGMQDSALFYMQKADSITAQNLLYYQRMNITRDIADLYAENNEYAKAYRALISHIAVRDSFNFIESKKKVKEIEDEYLIEKKEQENAFLRQNRSRGKMIIIVLSLLLLLLAAISAIAFIQQSSNRRKQQIIKKLNKKLITKNDDLRKANLTKDKFFSIISHDLRGPIGNLKNLMQLINQNETQAPDDSITKNHLLSIAEDEITKTQELLENLLTWSRTQFGKILFNPRPFKLKELVLDTTTPLLALAHHKSISVSQNIQPEVMVMADPEMLAFIVRNLLSNAIKFTDENGRISITSKSIKKSIELNITDTGVGLTSEQQKNLFKNGVTKSTPGTKNEPGTGLGLTLCKEFADKNKIAIRVESKKGAGTTFTLFIKRADS